MVWEIVVVAVTILLFWATVAKPPEDELSGRGGDSAPEPSMAILSFSSSSPSELAALCRGVPVVISVDTLWQSSRRLSSLASFKHVMTAPGPGKICALTTCAQLPILCTPREYCILTVFPISPNFRSSNIKNRCRAAMSFNLSAVRGLQSSIMSAWVFSMQIEGPTASARWRRDFEVVTSAETMRLVCLREIRWRR